MRSRTTPFLVAVAAGISACSVFGAIDFNRSGTGGGGTGGTTASSSSSSSSTSSSSTSSSSTSSSSTSSSSSSGTGGDGGTSPSCMKQGNPFAVFTASEIGTTALDGQLILVPDPSVPGHSPVVHLALASQDGSLYVRTITDQTNPIGPLTVIGAPKTCTTNADCAAGQNCDTSHGMCQGNKFSPAAGWVTPGSALMLQGNAYQGFGAAPSGLGQLSFPLDPNHSEEVQASSTPTFTPWSTPADCGPGVGFPGNIAIAEVGGGSMARYVVACRKTGVPAGMPDASLWLGTTDGQAAVQVASGMQGDPIMSPMAYAYVGGQHFVAFQSPGNGGGPGPGGFAFASSPTTFPTSTTPFSLVSGQIAVPMSLVPTAANDGITLFMASVAPSFTSASLWDGVVKTSDFATLGKTPPPTLQTIFTASAVTSIAGLGNPTYNASYVYFGQPAFSKTAVNFSWTRRDGSPLVLEDQIYSTSSNTVINAAAAPLGINAVVVWVESTPQGGYQVTGQELFCIGG